jgi:hypothetical protein
MFNLQSCGFECLRGRRNISVILFTELIKHFLVPSHMLYLLSFGQLVVISSLPVDKSFMIFLFNIKYKHQRIHVIFMQDKNNIIVLSWIV